MFKRYTRLSLRFFPFKCLLSATEKGKTCQKIISLRNKHFAWFLKNKTKLYMNEAEIGKK